MQLTEIRINLCPGPHGPHHPDAPAGQRLRAFCSLTFDQTFVVRDVKLIEGNGGLFLAMPSRKLCDHCPGCGEKNHLRARFCNGCGRRLGEDRSLRQWQGRNGSAAAGGAAATAAPPRIKLHADIAHPINAECRRRIAEQVIQAYWREVERSHQPGYVPPSLEGLDADEYEPYNSAPGRAGQPVQPVHPAYQH